MLKRQRTSSCDKGVNRQTKNGSAVEGENATKKEENRANSRAAGSGKSAGSAASRTTSVPDPDGFEAGSRLEGPASTGSQGSKNESVSKTGPVAKKDVSTGKAPPQPTRTSARLIKKPRRDFTLAAPLVVAAPPPPKKAKQPEKPAPRSRMWETEDKNAFFEGLFEHGKKFNKLQEFIKQRNKQRTGTSKTKDQIRHFYYNTWHKISKYIDGTGPEGTMNDKNRFAFEMYCLVNYGELRRRVGGKLDDRKGQKLNELVYKGQTVIRIAGKTHRIKTPMCRALKKLNNIITEESKEEEQLRVPEKVVLELRPRTNFTWERVQSIAQNPRLHITMPPGKRIGSVVEYLTKKWQLPRLKLKENLSLTEKPTEELRVYPPKGCQLHSFELKTVPPPIVTPVLTLETYLENMRSKVGSAESTGTPPPKKVCRRNSEGGGEEGVPHTDTSAKSADTMSTASKSVGSVKTDTSLDSTKSKSHSEGAPAAGSAGAPTPAADLPPPSSAVDIDAIIPDELKNVLPTFGKPSVEPAPGTKDSKGNSKSSKNSCKKPCKTDPALEKYREGWTAANAGKFSAAEVYLLLGGPEKLVLEYEWVEIEKEQPPLPEIAMLTARFSNMMRRLVHIASTEFTDFNRPKPNPVIAAAAAASAVNSPPSKCSCGAAINNNNTPPGRGGVRSPRVTGANFRSPSTPKSIQPKQGVSTPKSSKISADCQGSVEQISTLSPILPAPPPDGSARSDESPFRVPNGLPLRSQQQATKVSPNTQADQNFLQQLSSINKSTELMFPMRRRKQNRNVRKPLVVQRSILPKQNTRQIMTLTLSQNGMFVPVAPTELMAGQVVPTTSASVTLATTSAPAPLALAAPTTDAVAMNNMIPSHRPRAQLGSRIQMRPAPRMSTVSQLNQQRALQAAALVQAANESAKNKPPQELIAAPKNNPTTIATQQNMPASTSHTGGLLSFASTAVSTVCTQPLVSTLLGKPHAATTTFLGKSVPVPSSTILDDSLLSGPTSSLLRSTSPVVGIDGLSNLTLPSIPDTTTDGDGPISALLDLSIPDTISSKFDLGLENSNASFSAFLDSSNLERPGKDPNLATTADKSDTLRELRSLSPGKLCKNSSISVGSTDSQWVPVEDFSLSNFLNSPLKKPSDVLAPPALLNEGSRDSLVTKFDVDSALQSMMNENSMDYSAKFADLAAQIAASAPARGHDHL